MGQRRDQPVAHCWPCGFRTVRDDDGGCLICRVRAESEAKRERARAGRQEARDRLGMAPYTRSLDYARYGLTSATERLADAAHYAPNEDARHTALVALDHIHAARRAMDDRHEASGKREDTKT